MHTQDDATLIRNTAANHLRNAQRLIKTHGWTQEWRQSPDGRFSADGALSYSAGKCRPRNTNRHLRHRNTEAWDWAAIALIDAIGTEDILGWNDHPNRTEEEVVKAFEDAEKSIKKGTKWIITPKTLMAWSIEGEPTWMWRIRVGQSASIT